MCVMHIVFSIVVAAMLISCLHAQADEQKIYHIIYPDKVIINKHTHHITFIISSPKSLKQSLILPSNIKLKFSEKGFIDIANGYTLTINGEILSEQKKIFAGRGNVIINPITTVRVYPSWFGVENGKLDSENRFQSFLNTLSMSGAQGIIPAGFMVSSDYNLYMFGSATLFCNSRRTSILRVDGDLSTRDDAVELYWLNLGITAKSGREIPWRGYIKNCTFTATPYANFSYPVMIHSADGFSIEHNVFDWRGQKNTTLPVASVEGFNNYKWCKTCLTRRNGSISHNTVLAKQDEIGGEGLGINTAEHITFDNNYVYGVGDDPIAVHGSKNIRITNNQLFSTDGRIIFDNSNDIHIEGNYMERIAGGHSKAYYSGGAYIYGSGEMIGLPAPSNITIKNNLLKIPKTLKSSTYAIRVIGVKKSWIADNTIVNDSANQKTLGISIEAGYYPQRKGQNDFESGRIMQTGNIHVLNNRCIGQYPMGIGMTGDLENLIGPFVFSGNLAKKYQVYAPNSRLDESNKKND